MFLYFGTPHKAQCVLVFECMNYELCILHYALKQLQYVWINSLQILVDFFNEKWRTTKHNVHLFCYACKLNYVSCIMRYAISIMHECILFHEILNALSQISFAFKNETIHVTKLPRNDWFYWFFQQLFTFWKWFTHGWNF